jgi:TonB family protein
MFMSLIAGAAAAAAQPGAASVVDPNGEELFVADMAAAVACLDRYYEAPESDAVGQELARTLLAPRESPVPAGDGESRLPPPVAACVALAPVGTRARSAVATYANLPLILRALRARLAAASVDVASLDRLVGSPELRVLSLLETHDRLPALVAALQAVAVPEAQVEPAVGYMMLARIERLYWAITHPPAQPARQTSGSIGEGDYPRSALRRNRQGRATITFTINPEGGVEGCEVVRSAGDSSLDERACTLVTRRYRFEPARDASGRPIPQIALANIVWRLP